MSKPALLFAFLATIAVSVILAHWLGSRPEPVATAVDAERIERRLSGLEEGLERLVALLEEERAGPLRAAPAPGASATGGPGDAGDPGGQGHPGASGTQRRLVGSPEPELQELVASLQDLQSSLRQDLEARGLQGTAAEAEPTVLERIREDPREVEWNEWEPILALWRQDHDLARKEVKLLTDHELLQRFGPPTDVWSNTNGITWQYARDFDPVTEKYGQEIILRVPDGYVTQLAVRELD